MKSLQDLKERLQHFWLWHKPEAPRWYWWLAHRLHPRYRYHVIQTTLKPGYYDPCIRAKAALFAMVAEYYDYTKDLIDWSGEGHAEAFQAMQKATEFWRKNRKRIQYDEEDKEFQRNTQEVLKDVIEHLDYYWYP